MNPGPGRASTPIDFPSLYAILDLELAAARGLSPDDVLHAWLEAGVRLIQLRAKTTPSGQFLDVASRFAEHARSAGATFIVNDRADVARLSGASGLHIGQTDLSPTDARKVIGASAILGVSTHTDEQVARALDEPADYLAIGPVFATSSKHRPDPVVGLDGVGRAAAAARSARLPVVAIGGITLAQAPSVIAAGAQAVAVISDLLTADATVRARAFLSALG